MWDRLDMFWLFFEDLPLVMELQTRIGFLNGSFNMAHVLNLCDFGLVSIQCDVFKCVTFSSVI